LFDGSGEGFGGGGLCTVEEVGGERGSGWFGWACGFDVFLFVGFDGFAELDLFGVTLFGIEFGAEAVQ